MGLLGRLGGTDNVPAANLQADQLALAGVVYEILETIEPGIRQALEQARSHPWRGGAVVQTRLVTCWIVQACYATADAILRAVTVSSPHGDQIPGGAAPVIEQLLRYALEWVPRLRAATASEQPTLDVTLPAPLPPIPRPATHNSTELRTMFEYMEALKAQAELALTESVHGEYVLPRELTVWREALEREQIRLRGRAEQLELRCEGGPTGVVLGQLCSELAELGHDFFRFGQQALMPHLFRADFRLRPEATGTVRTSLVAGVPVATSESADERRMAPLRRWLGFSPWLLTAPERRRPDEIDFQALDTFWRKYYDPADLVKLKRLVDSVEAELKAGTIVRRTEAGKPITLRECPWAPVYVAVRRIDIGESVAPGGIFAVAPHLTAGAVTHLMPLGTDPRYVATRPHRPPVEPEKLWALTDPGIRRQRESDPAAQAELAALWEADDAPERTQALLRDLRGAESAGRIKRRPSRMALRSCPWPSTFVAVTRTSIGENIRAGRVFALVMGVEKGTFVRRIHYLN
jgi:hypothetical protein